MRANFRNRLIGSLLAALLFSTGAAVAQDRTELVDGIMATGPLTCTNDAYAVLRPVLMRVMANDMARAVNGRLKRDARWVASPEFEKVRDVVATALVASEVRSGPLFGVADGTAGIRASFEAMPVKQLHETVRFFARPAGRFYWKYLIEYVTCDRLIAVLRGQALAPAPGAALLAQHKAYDDNMDNDMAALSREDHLELGAGTGRLRDVMKAGDTIFFRELPKKVWHARKDEIMRAHAAQLEALTRTYVRHR